MEDCKSYGCDSLLNKMLRTIILKERTVDTIIFKSKGEIRNSSNMGIIRNKEVVQAKVVQTIVTLLRKLLENQTNLKVILEKS